MAKDRTAEFQTIINADPEIQRILQLRRTQGPSFKAGSGTDLLNKRLDALFGKEALSDYAIDANTGQISRDNAFFRNADWIVPAASFGVAGGLSATLGAFGAGGGAGGAAGAGGGLFNAAGTGGATGGYSLASTGLGAAGAASPGLTSGLFRSPDFWSTLLGTGVGLYGMNQANSASQRAADEQAKALQNAIDLQKEMFERETALEQSRYNQTTALEQARYDTRRNDLSPYRASGQGSVGKLAYLLGVPGFEGGPTSQAPQAQPPASPIAPTGGMNLGALAGGAPAGGNSLGGGMAAQPQQMVTLQSPDGMTTKPVPASQAEFFISKGAVRV